MTASTVKSTKLTALQAASGVKTLASQNTGQVYSSRDTIEAATTSLDETDDVILFGVVLPSNAVLISLKIFTDDLDNGGTSLASNVGLFAFEEFTSAAGTLYSANEVIDADCLGSAITDGQAASKTGVENAFEANDIINVNKKLWEVAGLTADPGTRFIVGMTVTTAAGTPAAGSISVSALYTVA